MSHHLDRLAILEYIEGVEDIDHAAIECHLVRCADCRAVWEELRALVVLLGDGSIFSSIDDEEAAERDKPLLWDDIVEEHEMAAAKSEAAETFYSVLQDEPLERWDAHFSQRPDLYTGAMVQRILQGAAPELDRQPERALMMTGIAERVAAALAGDERLLNLGHVLKQRSNALRQLGQYDAALDASTAAERYYAALATGDFDLGQAQYTRAITLFKMTRYDAALRALAEAHATLEPYGLTAPLAKTMMLDALIRIEQGDVTTAREILGRLLPLEEALGQPLEVARVHANLAECCLRAGALAEAMTEAVAAREAYQAMGIDAEVIRADWTLAMVRLAYGDVDALDRLARVASAFERLNMIADAGFVKLDITQELLRFGEWADAARVARELVTTFTAAGATVASVNALAFLRQAVEHREATEDTVRYIRDYVAADNPARPFDPPHEIVQ